MSVDLCVALTRRILMPDLLTQIQIALSDLLFCNVPWVVCATILKDGARQVVPGGPLAAGQCMVIELGDSETEILVLFDRPIQGGPNNYSQEACIAVHGGGTSPRPFALAAAVAIALATIGQGQIRDETFSWTSREEQSPQTFLEALRANKPQYTLQEAFHDFYKKMNKH